MYRSAQRSVQVLESVPEDVAVKILRQSFCPSGPQPVTIAVPPVRIPDAFLALPPALITPALRACAPSIDRDQVLNVSLHSAACMAMVTAALPALSALQDVQITVSFEAPDEDPYAQMLRTVCLLPQLTLLQLSDETVMDHHIISFAGALLKASKLRVLKLDAQPATDAVGLPFGLGLCVLTTVTRVHLSTVELLQNTAEFVRQSGILLPHIREMYFDRLFMTKTDLAAFFGGRQLFPNAEVLELGYDADRYGFGAHDDIDVREMAEGAFSFPRMRNFCVRDYRSGSEAGLAKEMLGRPSSCPHLSRLDLSYSLNRGDSADLGRLLTEMPQLAALVLRQPSDDEGALQAHEYGHGLAALTGLTNLDLSGSQLAGPSAAALADALQSLTSLEVLSLNSTLAVGTSAVENDEVESVMAGGLALLGGMRELQLEHCFLCAEKLAVAVEGMPQLQQLWLRGMVLGEGGARALAHGLLHVPGLQVLHLGQSLLDPRGLQALAPGLAALGGLTQLNLSYCQMGREGAEELAGALCPEAVAGKRQRQAVSPALVVLDVSYSQLGREGAAALLPALLKMQSLREVNVQQSERALSDGMLADLRAANADLYVCR